AVPPEPTFTREVVWAKATGLRTIRQIHGFIESSLGGSFGKGYGARAASRPDRASASDVPVPARAGPTRAAVGARGPRTVPSDSARDRPLLRPQVDEALLLELRLHPELREQRLPLEELDAVRSDLGRLHELLARLALERSSVRSVPERDPHDELVELVR